MSVGRHFIIVALATLLGACISQTTGSVSGTVQPSADEAALQYYHLGARYYREEKYSLARDRLIRALEYDPRMADAHSMLALTYDGLDNPRLASEHFDKAVRLEPDNYNVRNAYGVFLCQQREYDEATKQFDRAVKVPINDDPEVMLTNAGICISNKPDYDKAEAYFREALALKPSYGEPLLQLAALKYETENYLHARAFIQRYMEMHPSTAEVLYLAIQIEQATGNDREAADLIDDLLGDFPQSPEARAVLNGR